MTVQVAPAARPAAPHRALPGDGQVWQDAQRRSRARRRALAQEAARQRSSRYYAQIPTNRRSANHRTAMRWGIRAMLSTDPDTPRRVRDCGVVTLGEGVQIRAKDGDAYFAGLKTCGSMAWCPVCNAKIRARKGDELATAVASWTAAGHAVTAVALTVSHHDGDSLAKLIGTERQGWAKIVNGGAWTRLRKRLGLAGYVNAWEVTHSYRNGWHPHYHVLFFHDQPLDADGIAALHAHIYSRWAEASAAAGLDRPDPVKGVFVQPNCDSTRVAQYLAKVQEGDWGAAQEMTRGDLKTARKGSRVPFEILADYQGNGDVEDLVLWREYIAATKRMTMIRWSRGLRELVLPDAEELTDEEIAAQNVGGQLVAHMTVAVWQRVVMARLELAVLDAAENGGAKAVNDLLAANGCGWVRAGPLGEGDHER
jgi:hypothetical protein